MRPDLEHYYLIDQYLENNLQGEELAAFENQLLHDTFFAQQVAEQRMLNDLILEAELKSVRTQIEKDLHNIQQPSFFRMHWQWISVGLLCLTGILYFVFPVKKEAAIPVQAFQITAIENKNNAVIEPAENKHTVSDNIQATPASAKTVTTTNAVTNTDTIQSVTYTEPVTIALVPVTKTTEPVLETKQAEELKKIDCSATKITVALHTETSCMNARTGVIHIDNITGGNAPYTFTLNNKKIKDKTISELAAGTYVVKVSDKNGCIAEHSAAILEKNCSPAIQQGMKFNINPGIGEVCSIPFDTDKKGNLTIYNRSGKIIYRAANPSGDAVEWNGTDGYGALAEAGLYVYIIDYTDGTKVSGEVNITR